MLSFFKPLFHRKELREQAEEKDGIEEEGKGSTQYYYRQI
jgi:hypothetical protein